MTRTSQKPPQVSDQLPPYYKLWSDIPDPYEYNTGPFFYAAPPDVEQPIAACVTAPHHLNGSGYLHGGFLMSFADFAVFVFAKDNIADTPAVTLSMQFDFLRASTSQGDVIYARGSITRNTRSIIFVRGEIMHADALLGTFSSTLKKIGV